MSLYHKLNRAIALFFITRIVKLKLHEPIASFVFDDVPNSAFINGTRILKKYGFNGTYYISMGMLDENEPQKNYFDPSFLAKIVADGGELGCHTYNHIKLFTSSKEEILAELEKNQKKIREKIPGYIFSNFAYPFGQQTFASKIIVKNKFLSARGSMYGLNKGYVDLYNLRSIALYESRIKIESIFSQIDDAIKSKSWIILYTHDVDVNFSYYGCSPEYYEKIAKYCDEKKIKVLTVGNAVQMINEKK